MVIRPPIESWSRPELEDKYHSIIDNYRELQKNNKELEKKVSQLNSRFRKSIFERKAKEDHTIEKERYDELVRDNELLLMKLKTAKHQLLTYTAPNARSTTYSAMTGRLASVPMSTVRKNISIALSDRSHRGQQHDENTGKGSERMSSNRNHDTSLSEKANVIKLNRTLREKNAQIAELQYEIERLTTQLQSIRTDLDGYKSQTVIKSENDSLNTEKIKESQLTHENELAKRDLDMVRKELIVLKEANERLIKQSLNYEFADGANDIVSFKKEIVVLEEKLRESEKIERETAKKRRHERRQYEEWKQHYRQRIKALESKEQNRVSVNKVSSYEQEFDITPRSDISHIDRGSKRRKQKAGQEITDDILLRLYNDVAGLLEAHNGGPNANDFLLDGGLDLKSAEKWQKMYAELYDELEKVRNMLLIQHNINQKQNTEISVLNEECERLRVTAEEKLNDMRDQLKKKHQEVILLEEKIRSIAYAGQKPVTFNENSSKTSDDSLTSELSIRLLSLRFTKSYHAAIMNSESCPSSVFLSLEFFDFELQTTPHLQFLEKQPMDHTTIYNLVCSNLLLHYLQTNGITIELYRPHSNSYHQLGTSVISLAPLLRKKIKKYEGTANVIDIKSGHTIAAVTYEITLGQDLNEAITSYKQAERAQTLLPLNIKSDDNMSFDYLIIQTHRCSGIQNEDRRSLELCLVHELLSFSPFFTDPIIATNSTVEFGSKKEWPIPSEQIKHLKDQEIIFFLVNTSDDKKGDGILGVLSLPFAPLLNQQAIKGSFNMKKPDGAESGLILDISVFWKHIPLEDTNNNRMNATTIKREQTESGMASRPINYESSNSSSTNSSPARTLGQRKPSVIESPEEELWEFPRTVEIVRSPASSSRSSSSSVTTVEEITKDSTPTQTAMQPYDIENKDDFSSPPKLQSPSESTSSDDNSQNSTGTYTKEKPNVTDIQDESIESDGMTVENENTRERERDEIRSLLGNLPPIAKPRLSKIQSDFDSANIFKLPIQHQIIDTLSDDGSDHRDINKMKRNVVFTQPLHQSISPSESSSLASPTSKRDKPVVPLPDDGGKSVIKSVPRPLEIDYPMDDTIIGTVTLYIDQIYNFEYSPLMHPSYKNIKLYIDWTFLDFPPEDCRVIGSKLLDHTQQPLQIKFNFRKEYHLTRKRVALLEQYIELHNKLEFCLMTDTEEDSEELAVALLELVSNPSDQILTLSLLDVSGIKYANIDLALFYKESIFEESNVTSL